MKQEAGLSAGQDDDLFKSLRDSEATQLRSPRMNSAAIKSPMTEEFSVEFAVEAAILSIGWASDNSELLSLDELTSFWTNGRSSKISIVLVAFSVELWIIFDWYESSHKQSSAITRQKSSSRCMSEQPLREKTTSLCVSNLTTF